MKILKHITDKKKTIVVLLLLALCLGACGGNAEKAQSTAEQTQPSAEQSQSSVEQTQSSAEQTQPSVEQTQSTAEQAQTPAEQMPISNFSEIAPLKKVLIQRPGDEFLNLTPNSLEGLLFDDIPYLKTAQEEHDSLADTLRAEGVEVVYLTDLVAEALDAGGAEARKPAPGQPA